MVIKTIKNTARHIRKAKKLTRISISGALIAPFFISTMAFAAPKPVNAYVAPTTVGTGDCSSAADACATFAQAMTVVKSGGTIFVATGNYTENINVTVPNITIEDLTPNTATVTAVPGNYGVLIANQPNVTISGLDFITPSGDNNTYALHAYDAEGLTLTDDNFSASGTTKTGGVDINSTPNVTMRNVSATGFSKNGFAFTAKYTAGDEQTSHLKLANITALDNAWSGVAFYTVSGQNVGADINDVTFNGANTIAGSQQSGVFIEGDSDTNLGIDATPRYTVTGPNSTRLSLGSISFSNNFLNVVNYQVRNVGATGALFDGSSGNYMNESQRQTEEQKIIDHSTYKNLGSVYFYRQVDLETPIYGTSSTNAGTLSWYPVPAAISYNYESSNTSTTIPGSNQLASLIYGPRRLKTTTIDASGTPPGVYYWQVQAVFPGGSTGPWSEAWEVIVVPPPSD